MLCVIFTALVKYFPCLYDFINLTNYNIYKLGG